jgi:uncharacterized protein
MSHPESALPTLLKSMQPVLNEGVYVLSSVPPDTDLHAIRCLATFREAEGLTVILEEAEAQRLGWPVLFRAAWITLTVHSDLHAVGLTAAFAAALAEADISCNVVAGAYHDHIFVPVESGCAALAALQALQRRATVTF